MGSAIGELIEREEITLDVLNGKKLGVDSYNILYQFLSSIRGQDGTPLMDSEGNVTSHLTGLLYRTTNLLEKGLKPVFIFDGTPHQLKSKTLEKRKKIRTEAIQKHEEALKKGDMEEARKMGSRALKLTPEMVDEAKELIKMLGLPVIQAPSEGEAQIAHMVADGKLEGCISQDFDALLFGTPVLFRNIAITGKRKVPGKNFYIDVHPERIEMKKVMEKLNIDRKKMIWVAILVGTDFNDKFPKIGPKTALKLVSEHNSFEDIIKATKYEPDFDYREIEKLFMEPPYTDDYKIEFNPPENEKVIEFLCEKHDFSKDRVNNALAKLDTKAREKGEQSNLKQWFG